MGKPTAESLKSKKWFQNRYILNDGHIHLSMHVFCARKNFVIRSFLRFALFCIVFLIYSLFEKSICWLVTISEMTSLTYAK